MKAGERVLIGYKGREVEGLIVLASANGKSLLVTFEAMLGGYVGTMPVLNDGDGYRDLIEGEPVTIRGLPVN